jgi:molybdenum cofactor biosynthesis enzyme MoaA
MRQRVTKEYTILGIDTAKPSIKNAEINLGNLCNLKCLMCQEQESSSILAENVRLGINILNQQDLKWNEAAHAHAKKIVQSRPRVLNIRGGEPFYNKDLLNLVRDIPDQQARQMMLHITTNATIWNKEWQEALARFRSVRMMFSVDATDDLYEYMRFPGSWADTSSNIQQIIKLPNVNGMIHCVVQNLNIARLQSVIDWSIQCGIQLEFDLLWKPAYLKIVNLPRGLKQQAISSVQGLLSNDYPTPIIDFLSKCNTILLESQQQDNTQLWQEFKKQIEPRDHLRGNSYTDFLKDPQ